MLERPRRSILCSPALCTFLLAAPIAAEEAALGWPRELEHAKGRVLIYQPQIESLEGNKLRSRAAVSVTLAEGDGSPVFGVIWSDARVLTDRDERTIRIVDVDVTDVRFPNITEDHRARFKSFVESRIEEWDMVISLDRVEASLAAVEDEQNLAEELKTGPPVILYSDQPAVLIQIDGEPRYRSIEDDKLKKVLNTPYTIVREPKKKKYYIDGGIEWYAYVPVPVYGRLHRNPGNPRGERRQLTTLSLERPNPAGTCQSKSKSPQLHSIGTRRSHLPRERESLSGPR